MQFTNNSLCRSLMSVVTETSDEDPDDFANFSGLLPPNIWRAALEGWGWGYSAPSAKG